MSNSREQILGDIRRTLPVDSPLPELSGEWIEFADPRAQFLETLVSVGGAGRIAADNAELTRHLGDVVARTDAKRIASFFPNLCAGNVRTASVGDPHDLADVDLSILPGELAVAENAAVWVTTRDPIQRVLYYLSQHVALIIPGDRVVHTMHQAYAWIEAQRAGGQPLFAEPRFAAFISGPSKTADIEQALVIGAHGPRSLSVFLADQITGD